MLLKSSLSTLAAVAAAGIWGTSFPAASIALESFSPGALACVRFVISSLLVGLLMLLSKTPLPPPHILRRIALIGFIGIGFSQICISFGLKFSTSADAAFIVASSPVFVALISLYFGQSTIRKNTLIGIAIGATGLLLILLQSGIRINILGLLSITLASVSLATYAFFNSKLLAENPDYMVDSLQFLAIATWSSTLVFSIFWGVDAIQQIPKATNASVTAALFLAVFSGVLAYWLFSKALETGNPVATSGAIYLEPPFAILTAYFWLHEVPSLLAIVGGEIILIGVGVGNQDCNVLFNLKRGDGNRLRSENFPS